MRKLIAVIISVLSLTCLWAAEYTGRVVDYNGEPLPFATVYLEAKPEVGTATGSEGVFVLNTNESPSSVVLISFIGYEVQRCRLADFMADNQRVVTLKEQPVALQEMVVSAAAPKQKNKRKMMAYLLERVYMRMQEDFAETPARYRIVSDVRMTAEQSPWGMEQMIADVVNLPHQGKEGSDSIQFAATYCKRFFQQEIRDRADTILAGNRLDKNMRKAANEVDSGVVVHKSLWAMGNIRYDFERTMDDVRHWCVSNESETETVLTYTEKKNYLGIFKYTFVRHYIVDSETLSVKRFAEELTLALKVPFGYKFSKDDLALLNLLNMNDEEINKFRLKKADAKITLNTIYQRVDGKIYPQEKNLRTKAQLEGKEKTIPVDVKATQRVTSVKPNATPMNASEMTKRVRREIVSVF